MEIADSGPDDDPPSDIDGWIKDRTLLDKEYDLLGRKRGRPLKRETRNTRKQLQDYQRQEEKVRYDYSRRSPLAGDGLELTIYPTAIPGEARAADDSDLPPPEGGGDVEDDIPDIPFAGDDEDAPDLYVAKPTGGKRGERYDPMSEYHLRCHCPAHQGLYHLY